MSVNIYQFTTAQNTHNYALDNLADQYSIYIEVALLIGLVASATQLHHYCAPSSPRKGSFSLGWW